MNKKVGNLRQMRMFKPPKEEEKEEIKKKMKSRFDGRWVVVILFSLTLLASLFFYLRTELPTWFQDFLGPQVVLYKDPGN